MELMKKQWEEINSLAAEEFKHRTVLNRCGYSNCLQTTGLHYCPQCQIRQYCCNEHKAADSQSHKRFCRPPIRGVEEGRSVDRPAGYVPQSAQERKKTCEVIVNMLLDSLTAGVYPPENIESVFGIQMAPDDSDSDEQDNPRYIGIDTPVGTLMFGCWTFLYQCNTRAYSRDIGAAGGGGVSGGSDMDIEGFDSTTSGANAAFQFDSSGVNLVNSEVAAEARDTLALELVQALLEGRLPAWFRFKLSDLDRLRVTSDLGQQQPDAYCAEIKRRDFRGIQWNHAALASLAGK